MKSIRLLLLCLIINVSTFGQFNMPSFEEVVTYFYSKYTFDSYDSYLRFQRKKDGWFVSEDSYHKPGNYFNTKLFWSKETNTYKDLNYPLSNYDAELTSEIISKYLVRINSTYEEYQFQRNKYYGYPGWDWDVINDDTNQNNLTDSLLESKARAYSNYASGFIAEQFGDVFLNNDSDRLALKANEKISKSRIDKFIFYELKALDAFSKIKKINPYYETKVGNISIKLANEYMFAYLELLMSNDSIRAIEFAKKANYPDSLLSLSKSYLSALPFNSILITNGDNDTYPLWYLQQINKYRPDIKVLNYSLIGFRKYLSFIDNNSNERLFSVSDSIYLKDNFDYFLFGNTTNEGFEIDVEIFLSHLENNYNPYDTTSIPYKEGIIKKYYAKKLFFKIENKRKTKHFHIGDYIFMNDYILLDIINTSRKRKIFFTFNNELVSTLLTQNGNLYELKLTEEN